MRIISKSYLKRFWAQHPDVRNELSKWYEILNRSNWKRPAGVKLAFGARVDFVQVASGNTVAVFDIANNKYRLIAAIHYDHPRVFVLRILTHREYDKNKWKQQL